MALLAVPLLGCSPCDAWCDRVADAYDRCLSEWGLTWTDVGAADGPEEYADRCREAEADHRQGLSDADAQARDDACAAFNEAYAEAADCAQVLDVFERYPVTF